MHYPPTSFPFSIICEKDGRETHVAVTSLLVSSPHHRAVQVADIPLLRCPACGQEIFDMSLLTAIEALVSERDTSQQTSFVTLAQLMTRPSQSRE